MRAPIQVEVSSAALCSDGFVVALHDRQVAFDGPRGALLHASTQRQTTALPTSSKAITTAERMFPSFPTRWPRFFA